MRSLLRRSISLAFLAPLAACLHRSAPVTVFQCALQCALEVTNTSAGDIDVYAMDTDGGTGRLVGSVGAGTRERIALDNREAGLPATVYAYPSGAKRPVTSCRQIERRALTLSVMC